MTKLSGYHEAGVHVVIELVEDGQRLEFDVYKGSTRRKVRFEIGHVQGYGELFIERFEPAEPNDECDLRIKLVLPEGAGDRPAVARDHQVLRGTHADVDRLLDKQRAATRGLPREEDGPPFVAEPISASTDDPGAPTPEEIVGSSAGAAAVLAGTLSTAPETPKLAEVAMARQTAAPRAGEEEELQKLAAATVTVTAGEDPTPEEVAEVTNTTPPTPNEEKELEAKHRSGRRAPGFGGRLR